MKIILSENEIKQLQKEMGVTTISDIEKSILQRIPSKYHNTIQFKESSAGLLGILVPEQYSTHLIKVLNPKSSSSMKKLLHEWHSTKGKLMLTNPKLMFALKTVEKEIYNMVKSL